MNHATKKELIAISSAVLRVFFATMIAQIIASGVGILDTDGDAWRTYANSGISSGILVIYAYINPKDPRFGKSKSTKIVEK